MTTMQNQPISARLGPNGFEMRTRDHYVAEYKNAMIKNALDPFVMHDAAEVRRREHAQAEALDRFSKARFHSFRDASNTSLDVQMDPDHARRGRQFSLTRDAINGPQQSVNSCSVSDGRFGPIQLGSVGHDRMRFMEEAGRLATFGLIDRVAASTWDSDESVYELFSKVHAMVLDEARAMRTNGRPSNRVIDAAPGMFLFTELLKRTEVMIEEDFTELHARSIFPIVDLNTWLPQWLYTRRDRRGVFPQPVDIAGLPSAAPRGSENRSAVPRPLMFWHSAAAWTELELAQYAEAIANGAARIDLSKDRIDTAIQMMDWYEDCLAFFGNDELDIHGLFSPQAKTGIERIPSGGGFGTGGDSEYDRALLLRDVQEVIANTERRLNPDTILLPTRAWLYLTVTRYGSTAADSNQTILQAAADSLRDLGIKEVLWCPEVGWSQVQEDRLLDHGVGAAEAEKLAGGLNGDQTMVIMNRSDRTLEMVVAKNRVMFPSRQTVNDNVEARMLQGGGGLAIYKPEAVKIVTDIGPV